MGSDPAAYVFKNESSDLERGTSCPQTLNIKICRGKAAVSRSGLCSYGCHQGFKFAKQGKNTVDVDLSQTHSNG